MWQNSLPKQPIYNRIMDRRTWVFVANRFMTSDEVERVNNALEQFVATWSTHGTPIDATAFCFESAVVVIAANESEVQASGCSIDKINQLMRALGQQINIDFFDRFNVLNRNESGGWAIEKYTANNANSCVSATITSLDQLNQLILNQ